MVVKSDGASAEFTDVAKDSTVWAAICEPKERAVQIIVVVPSEFSITLWGLGFEETNFRPLGSVYFAPRLPSRICH